MFVVSFFGFFSSELSFELVDGYIYALVGIFTAFGCDEDFAVLAASDYFDACAASLVSVDNDLDLIDAVVIFWKLRGLFLCMASDSFGYFYVFSCNSEKQGDPP